MTRSIVDAWVAVYHIDANEEARRVLVEKLAEFFGYTIEEAERRGACKMRLAAEKAAITDLFDQQTAKIADRIRALEPSAVVKERLP
jgi:hypothetical protein